MCRVTEFMWMMQHGSYKAENGDGAKFHWRANCVDSRMAGWPVCWARILRRLPLLIRDMKPSFRRWTLGSAVAKVWSPIIIFSAFPSSNLGNCLLNLAESRRIRCNLTLRTPVTPAQMANAASGMAVSDDCKLKFLELKRKKTHRFIIFKIDEKIQQIIVEKLGEPTESYESFTASLPDKECRYAVYDFDFVTEENCQKSKIFFISWSPDTSKVRSKMLYASSKDRFRRELDGVHCEVQATDPTEMGLDVIRGRAN